MTRKGRRSFSLWKECETCTCIINAKDLEIHTKSCPPDENNWDHNYIKQQVFFTSWEAIDPKVIPSSMRSEMVDNIIFLSQPVMQICGFIIGFPVLIRISDKKCIKIAWPTSEISSTSVMLSKEALEINSDVKVPSNLLTVSKLQTPPKIASEIFYKIINIDEESIKFDELEIILKNKLKDKVFFVGNKFLIQFYGKRMIIQIVDCKHYKNDILEIKDLSLDEFAYSADENSYISCSNRSKSKTNCNFLQVPEAIKFGGYESIMDELKRNIFSMLEHNIPNDDVRSFGALIFGIHGIGKTLAMHYLTTFFEINVVNILPMEIFSKYYGETEGKLRSLFKNAIVNAPSIILIDNIEVLCPKKATDQERRIVSTLLSLFDEIQHQNIVVLTTSSNPDAIDPSLRRPGRLEIEIEIPVPGAKDRLAIMTKLLPDVCHLETLKKLAEITHGFVGADLAALIGKAQSAASLAGRNVISKDDLVWAHSQVIPSAMREVFVQVPNVKWCDIAGQEDLKLKLRQCVEWPVKFPDSFTRLGIKPPRGVLLYGPPGCSKTMIAKAIATESQLNFLSIKGSDIFSKWVGESERSIRDVFKRARSVAPCIIFIDEVDALGSERESTQRSGGNAVQERVLSQLLTEMDGVMPLENVIIIAATNRPDRIDKALLRPGRLDRIIYVPLPDYPTRKQLFELQFKKMPVESSINIKELAEMTDGYSGAEIIAVCNEAAFKALEENMEADIVLKKHVLLALKMVTPRTPQSLLDLYIDYVNR